MKKLSVARIVFFILTLSACARSPETQFYVLNPIPFQSTKEKPYQNLRIGLREITIPAYMAKQQIIVHHSPHHVKLSEFHQWAGSIDKNIQRVVETNISTLLPGAVVQSFPWNIQFKPEYQLQIDISQFEVDIHGNSILRANYMVYVGDKIIKKVSINYHQHLSFICIDSLVESMNLNLNHLTRDIAKSLSSGNK
jgi:uncharacterized lipoprotein YmbA